eukprot:5184228-Pyramimonas_sp.AAC.1
MQRVAMLCQHPDLAAAIRATTPFGTPRQGQATGSPTGSPMAFPTADQPEHRQSTRERVHAVHATTTSVSHG